MGSKDFREVYHKLAIVVDNGYCCNSLNIAEQKIKIKCEYPLEYGDILRKENKEKRLLWFFNNLF